MPRQRFEMPVRLHGDERTDQLLSAEATIRSWLRMEAALATAQSELGV